MLKCPLTQNPTFSDLQKYIVNIEIERGFTNETIPHKCLILGEEVCELSQALNKKNNTEIANELADVFILTITVANRLHIDLQQTLCKQNNFSPTVKTINSWQKKFTPKAHEQNFLLLLNNMGHLFKTVRKNSGLKIDATAKCSTYADSLSEIVILLFKLANQNSINLETAFRDKDSQNMQRVWT